MGINGQERVSYGIDVAGAELGGGCSRTHYLGGSHFRRNHHLGSDTFVARRGYRAPRPLVGAARVILWHTASRLWVGHDMGVQPALGTALWTIV